MLFSIPFNLYIFCRLEAMRYTADLTVRTFTINPLCFALLQPTCASFMLLSYDLRTFVKEHCQQLEVTTTCSQENYCHFVDSSLGTCSC